MEFPERVAFFSTGDASHTITGDRTEFVGRNGTLSNPAAMTRSLLSGRVGAGLDACAAMREAWFVRTASTIPSFIDRNDERLRILLELAGDVGQGRILDVGCGKGRYLWYLQNKFPRTELHACDISSELLQSVPLGVRANVAPVTLLPYPDNFFDLVVCVEALEHAVFIEQALAELRRVTKPGGRLLVIDKDRDAWGTLPVAPWEQWFEAPFLEHSVKLRMDRGLFRAWYEDLPRIKIETSS